MGRAPTTVSASATQPVAARRVLHAVSRLADLLLASALLVVTAPLMAVVALAIRQSSHGPALYRAPRTTRDGRSFTRYRFRTMVDGASTDFHRRHAALVGEPLAGNGDPRLTRMGRFLRRTRLERLPELVNVVAGHASLFGRR